MAPPEDDGHDCGWKAYAKAQDAKLAALSAKIDELERRARGHKSERRKQHKLPPPVPAKSEPDARARTRSAAAALRTARTETEVVPVPVPPEQRRCPAHGDTMRTIGAGKPSLLIEYVHGYFRRRLFQRETCACRCGHMITAPAPDRVGDKTRYAPSFIAHVVVSKCGDSIPQYRLAKAYTNIGIPMSRSTLCDLFHRAARELAPVHDAALKLVPKAPDVHADETSIRQQGANKRAFIWNFVTKDLVVYRYAPSRSGETPKQVLGDSKGRLVVDAFTGYNAVTSPGKRTRAGCLAHARRKLFEQREHAETKEALDLIGDIYLVEREAKQRGIVGTDAHLELRRRESRTPFARLLRWAHRLRPAYEPRSGMGRAIRYLLKNWREHGQFLRHASIPPDNNIAEAALRRVALGRSNFLFVGNEAAGHDLGSAEGGPRTETSDRADRRDLATLYTLVASCEKHGVNAIAYLTDVLTRVHTHAAARVEDLLPHRWKPPATPG